VRAILAVTRSSTKGDTSSLAKLSNRSKEFILKDYETGNSENTVDFMKYLQAEYQDQRIVLIWDGATYHKSQYIKDFLALGNHGKDRVEWPFTCILSAPHSPEQNPVEDVWLHGKNGLRSIWHLLASFPAVKYLFEFCLNYQKFDFHKIKWYLPCSALY
jgi:transposase